MARGPVMSRSSFGELILLDDEFLSLEPVPELLPFLPSQLFDLSRRDDYGPPEVFLSLDFPGLLLLEAQSDVLGIGLDS